MDHRHSCQAGYRGTTVPEQYHIIRPLHESPQIAERGPQASQVPIFQPQKEKKRKLLRGEHKGEGGIGDTGVRACPLTPQQDLPHLEQCRHIWGWSTEWDPGGATAGSGARVETKVTVEGES